MATGPRTLATNRKARHDYFIEETFEAGIALTGTEIKAARAGSVNLREGFVIVRAGEAWLMGVHIGHYKQGNLANHVETRSRKLLLHRRQIDYLHEQATQRNWTIVPLRMYINAAGRRKSPSRWCAARGSTTNANRSPAGTRNGTSAEP